MTMIVNLLLGLAFAGGLSIYVSPIETTNYNFSTKVDSFTDPHSPFYFASMYIDSAKMKNERGVYETVGHLSEDTMLYNEKTIKTTGTKCDYKAEPLTCSMKEGHHYIETTVSVTDSQLIVRSTFYSPKARVLSSSSRTDEKIVIWIRQQEITVTQKGNQTTTTYGKEELPLKWEIPHKLLEEDVRQTMMSLLIGAKIK